MLAEVMKQNEMKDQTIASLKVEVSQWDEQNRTLQRVKVG